MSLKAVLRQLVPRSTRNWVRSPSKTIHWGWNEIQYRLGHTVKIELRPGWPLMCHPASYRMAYSAQVCDPDQISEFDSFVAHCRSGMVLFDIGAHFGIFSLAALHFGGSSARAVAVDPSPRALRMLKRQAAINGCADRLTIIQAAAGDESGELAMVPAGVNGSEYFLLPQDHTAGEFTHVKELTIDELVHITGLIPTHIKIDVEGFEAKVLKGGKHALSQSTPLLFLELHNQMVSEQNGNPQETLDLLGEFGYEILTMQGQPVCSQEIHKHALLRCIGRYSSRHLDHNELVSNRPK